MKTLQEQLDTERRITDRLLQQLNSQPGWVEIDWDNPPAERVHVFTPTDDVTMRHRIVPAGLIRTASDATHYKLLDEPV